jgi:uncharacterized membrane protein (UPF0127 family)
MRRIALRFPNGKQISVDVAETPSQREKGLMFKKSLPKDYGMLFVFPQALTLNFWMKNTWIPLDIIFIGPDKAVTRIYEGVRGSNKQTVQAKIARAEGWGQFVLELPAGTARKWGLKESQTLTFDVPIPQR